MNPSRPIPEIKAELDSVRNRLAQTYKELSEAENRIKDLRCEISILNGFSGGKLKALQDELKNAEVNERLAAMPKVQVRVYDFTDWVEVPFVRKTGKRVYYASNYWGEYRELYVPINRARNIPESAT